MILSPILRVNLHPIISSWIKQTRSIRPILRMDKDKFQICIDVHQFSKEELRIKARSEYVIIEGKQEKKTKKGCIIRQFVRKFKLPDGCTPQRIESKLSSDGYLTITAHRDTCNTNWPCETLIPISHSAKEAEPMNLIEIKPSTPEQKS